MNKTAQTFLSFLLCAVYAIYGFLAYQQWSVSTPAQKVASMRIEYVWQDSQGRRIVTDKKLTSWNDYQFVGMYVVSMAGKTSRNFARKA